MAERLNFQPIVSMIMTYSVHDHDSKESAETPYELVSSVLKAWITLTNAEPPTGTAAHCQKEWDRRYTDKVWAGLLESTSVPHDRARLLASRALNCGDWMLAPPVTALGLRLSDEEVRIAVGLR